MNNKKHERRRLRVDFILVVILVALLICWELYSNKNYSIIIWVIILSCVIIGVIYILFNSYEIRNKASTDTIKNLMSLQYENKLFHYFNFFKTNVVNSWKNYKIILCCVIIAILLIIFEPILFFAKHTYKLAEWISGIGSLSAAAVALFAVVHKPRPHIGHLKYSDPKHNTVIIQFFNTSRNPDFIRLKSIYMSNGSQSKEIPLYAEFNKMIIFNMINMNNSCTFVITDQIHLPFGKYSKIVFTELLDKFENQNKYTLLIFNFTNIRKTYNKSIHFVLNKDLDQK